MCGIAGVIDIQKGTRAKSTEQMIHDMVACIVHRGPDEDGFFVDESVGLGMRRLSIIDLSTGKQPITNADGTLLIFFNGEIYNYKELHEELVAKGYAFKTHSDTEVILHMYEAYGSQMLTRLRGMFTFSIYNTQTKKIFLARDFFGIKPLYYIKKNDSVWAFGSEIKSFLTLPEFIPEVNDSAVYNYLSFQYNPCEETFFKGVYKLPPAHYMEIDGNTGRAHIEKYWSFEFDPTSMLPETGVQENKTKEDIYNTILDSVEHHMIADVPVGSFLSGGVDSSIIAALMQKIRSTGNSHQKIKTFTIGWDTLTEGVEAKQTSDALGTDHTEIRIHPEEYFDTLPKAVWHFDEPVADPSAIGLYFVAREARKHVTVVLSGEGADELFGGYNIYLAPYAYRKVALIPKFLLKLVTQISFEFWGKNYIRRAHDSIENWYIGNASVFKEHEVKALWKGSRQEKYSLSPLYKQVTGVSDSTKMQYVDINTWLVGDILAKADKMTMMNSLELRVPFLDIKVAKLARTLPDSFKWRNGVTKYMLREAFKSIIPETTRNRKKLGFPTPIRDWLTAERQHEYTLILTNEYITTHMNTEYIRGMIDDHITKKVDNSRKIYLLLMLALWYDVFIKKS